MAKSRRELSAQGTVADAPKAIGVTRSGKTTKSRAAVARRESGPQAGSARRKTVALLGGSFNPPHVGHLMAALYVRACLGDDEVWLVPTFHHPFGKETVAYEHRVAMCEAAARDFGPWLKVSRAESEVKGEGRTIDLLEHLLPLHAGTGFRLVIGSDIIADLPKWKAWERIQQLVTVTVLNRAGYPASGAVGPPLAQVSSTEIRKGALDTALVPRAVVDYAHAHHLFGS